MTPRPRGAPWAAAMGLLDPPRHASLYCGPMAICIGVDEAGYGPNYGPLAIAATAWHVEPRQRETNGRFSSRAALEAHANSCRQQATAPAARRKASKAIDL